MTRPIQRRRRARNRVCRRKKRFVDKDAAWDHCTEQFRRYRRQQRPYRCPTCRRWHVATDKIGQVRQALSDKDKKELP